MSNVIICERAENEYGDFYLTLEMEQKGLFLKAENHDHYGFKSEYVSLVDTIKSLLRCCNASEREELSMVDFSAFDNAVDLKGLQEDINNAPAFEEVPDGEYIIGIDKMEIKLTKDQKKLMFAFKGKIKEGDQKDRMIFFNRVISGNKTTDKWNDGRAIAGVVTWVNEIIGYSDDPVEFINYTDFAEQILDVYQEYQNTVELEVEYDAKAFNPITIKDVFDV